MAVRAVEAGFLLQAIARGGALELRPHQEAVLEWLREAGMVRAAADPSSEREQLAGTRAELAQIAEQRRQPRPRRDLPERERRLRTRALELSERLAEIEGACELTSSSSGGPYRGASGASRARWLVTQKGRALLSDLAPRLVRIGGGSIEDFTLEMEALRDAIAARAARAAQIRDVLRASDGPALGTSLCSVAVGLSAVREEPPRIARAFASAFHQLRASPHAARFQPGQDACAAEALCLQARDLRDVESGGMLREMLSLRETALASHSQDHAEDALDAAVLLHALAPPVRASQIEVALALARESSARGYEISHSLTLLITAGDPELPPHLEPSLRAARGALEREVPTGEERLVIAALLTFVRGDLAAQLERWRVLREYLARFAPDGMGIAAALLSWIALEPSETLDDLRLAAAEIQAKRLADGGAETLSLAIKLLVSIAMLASGQEGDREEGLALAPSIAPRATQLGLHGAMSAVPLVTTILSAFHRPVLGAALERDYQSTHSSYVFGG